MSLDGIRRAYAENLGLRCGVRSVPLLQALAETPRERFLGPGPWILAGLDRGMAMPHKVTPDADPAHVYEDASVALDVSRNLYNGAPSVLIPWIDALDLRAGDAVFHLGGGAGYYTAIMAKVVGSNGRVRMVEIDDNLGNCARELLSKYGNVEVEVGDGGLYDPGKCDAMLVNAGVTHPTTLWLDRLKDGGRLLLPLTFGFPHSNLGKGAALIVTRRDTRFSATFLPDPMVIFSCGSVREPQTNEKLLSAYSTQSHRIGLVRSLRLDGHEADSTCWMHADSICLSTREILRLS